MAERIYWRLIGGSTSIMEVEPPKPNKNFFCCGETVVVKSNSKKEFIFCRSESTSASS